VLHGLGGSKEQPQIQSTAEVFRESGYSTIVFDATNTFGESDGNYEDATVTNYYEDLTDVIGWAKTQHVYREPFFLSGHSLGGMAIALYAEAHPEEIKGLAPMSTVISGELSMQTPKHKNIAEEWKKTGWRITERNSKPGAFKKLKWSHMEDRMKYDILKDIETLTMPVLIIVGDQDEVALPEHQKMLFEKLPGKKEFHVIKNAPHTFVEKQHLDEIAEIFRKWIAKVGE